MKIEITREDALHRDFTVALSETDFNTRVDARLTELMPDLRVPGFRPGKVPMKVMRQRFAERVHGEVIEKLVDETTANLVQEHGLKPAMQPKLEITEFDAKKGLTFTAAFIMAGEFDLMEEKNLNPTQYTIQPSETEIAESLTRLQTDMRTSAPIKKKRKSKNGDVLIMDFVGSVDGEKFDGGAAEGHSLELGSGQFIPGFEEQLVGLNAGDNKEVKVTFPAEYGAENLAGKDAVFAVTVNEIHDFTLPELNDAFAKQLGLDDFAALKDTIKGRMSQEYSRLADEQLRRELFDQLDAGHKIALADEMVAAEYTQLEAEYKQARENNSLSPDEMAQSEEDGLAELQAIAERRVRLALILAEYGRKYAVEVTEDDLRQQVMQEAENYPGQQQQFVDYLQKNQQAMQQMRSRAHESAIVRKLVELVEPKAKDISLADFQKMQEELDKKGGAKPTPKKKPAAKKATAKKTDNAPAEEKPAAKKKAPAKKTAAKKAEDAPAEEKPAVKKKAPAKKAAIKKD